MTGQPVIITTQKLEPVERTIMERLGNSPWQAADFTSASLEEARTTWRALRSAVGFQPTTTGWVTTSKTNLKMGKSGIPTIGVTLHSARRAASVWATVNTATQEAIAEAVGTSPGDISRLLKYTVCPHATKGCKAPCVPATSVNAQKRPAELTRLNRTVLSLARPDLALALLADELRRLHGRHGVESRWRVNIADDVRWEVIAPGLLSFGVPGYAYTKHCPKARPDRPNLSVVYSAHERMSDDEIAGLVGAGHRVAVVLDTKKGVIPKTWRGLPVVDGDVTDDLFVHPAGRVVGLSAKGVTNTVKEGMRVSGFSRSLN